MCPNGRLSRRLVVRLISVRCRGVTWRLCARLPDIRRAARAVESIGCGVVEPCASWPTCRGGVRLVLQIGRARRRVRRHLTWACTRPESVWMSSVSLKASDVVSGRVMPSVRWLPNWIKNFLSWPEKSCYIAISIIDA